jgi:hypothetical protein
MDIILQQHPVVQYILNYHFHCSLFLCSNMMYAQHQRQNQHTNKICTTPTTHAYNKIIVAWYFKHCFKICYMYFLHFWNKKYSNMKTGDQIPLQLAYPVIVSWSKMYAFKWHEEMNSFKFWILIQQWYCTGTVKTSVDAVEIPV